MVSSLLVYPIVPITPISISLQSLQPPRVHICLMPDVNPSHFSSTSSILFWYFSSLGHYQTLLSSFPMAVLSQLSSCNETADLSSPIKFMFHIITPIHRTIIEVKSLIHLQQLAHLGNAIQTRQFIINNHSNGHRSH